MSDVPALDAGPVSNGAIRLAEGLQSRLTDAVNRMVTAIATEVPYYALLPPEMLQGEVAEVCRSNLLAYLTCARQGRPPSEAELAKVREPALRRAEEGVPLEAVLLAWEVGNRVTWELMMEQSQPATVTHLHDVLEATRHSRLFLHCYVQVVAATYLTEREAIEQETGGGLRALAEHLLAGRPVGALPRRCGVAAHDRYVVVALSLQLGPQERGSRVGSQAASRRKVRRLLARLAVLAGEPVPSTLTGMGGVVLLPVGDREVGPAWVQQVVAALGEVDGGPVTATATWPRTLADLPHEAGVALDLLRITQALSSPPGLYQVEDLLLELPLLTAPLACARLAALLTPAETVPELLPTLQAWLDHDRNRRETAQALYIHANTLDRRLERLAGLTSLDLTTARGLATVQAALIARALARSSN